jgi:protein-L-isoaspartate(D-aspartate) O-methyltransferase
MVLQPSLIATLFAASAAAACQPTGPEAADRYEGLRNLMVRDQIEARGVRDPRVLAALRRVPRHEFVPENLRGEAYADHPLPIGWAQTISQPYVVALMSATLALQPGEKVLEIGTGSGYQAAVLHELGARVFSIEIVPGLVANARAALERSGAGAVQVREGNGWLGWPEEAPFDAVIVTAAPDEVPEALVDQLRDGGRMILPLGTTRQELVLLEKQGGRLARRDLIPVRFVPMVR